jgi:hypothetical protein
MTTLPAARSRSTARSGTPSPRSTAGAGRIALALDDDGRLAGVLTDGDTARALLRGASLDDPLAAIVTRDPVTVGPGEGRAPCSTSCERADRRDPGRRRVRACRPGSISSTRSSSGRSGRTGRVVMAGGPGSRLRPLTDSVPSRCCASPAGRSWSGSCSTWSGTASADLPVDQLPRIRDRGALRRRVGLRDAIEYLREEAPLGTAGALGLLPEAPSEPVLVLNGDLVTSADLGGLIDFHVSGGFDARSATADISTSSRSAASNARATGSSGSPRSRRSSAR